MANEALLTFDDNPTRTLAEMGKGDLIAGIRKARKLARSVGAGRVGNLMIINAEHTIAGGTTGEITFLFHQPFKLGKILYSNNTTATGRISGMKINGDPVQYNYGVTVTGGSPVPLTTALLASLGDMDIQEIFGEGALVTIQFDTCVIGDVVGIALIGTDLNWDRSK